jgi:hypothetical protein
MADELCKSIRHSNCIDLMSGDINDTDQYGCTILYTAAGYGDDVKLLIHMGAHVNMTSGKEKWTALHHAAFHNKMDNCVYLVKHGADAFMTDCFNRSAEEIAERLDHIDIQCYLRTVMNLPVIRLFPTIPFATQLWKMTHPN